MAPFTHVVVSVLGGLAEGVKRNDWIEYAAQRITYGVLVYRVREHSNAPQAQSDGTTFSAVSGKGFRKY